MAQDSRELEVRICNLAFRICPRDKLARDVLWELVSPKDGTQAHRSSGAVRCYGRASTSGGGLCAAALCSGLHCGAARTTGARTRARSYGGAPALGGGRCAAACCCGGHAGLTARSLHRVGPWAVCRGDATDTLWAICREGASNTGRLERMKQAYRSSGAWRCYGGTSANGGGLCEALVPGGIVLLHCPAT